MFRLAVLPDGIGSVYWPKGDRAALIIDRRLPFAERRAALTHELIHDERGGGVEYHGQPEGWAVIAAREERIVEDETARRLVPADELLAELARAEAVGEPLEVWRVAERFEVPDLVAERAMRLLGQDGVRLVG